MDDEPDDLYKLDCERCGKKTPHSVKGGAVDHDEIEWEENNGQIMTHEISWVTTLFQCTVCSQLSLHYRNEDDDNYKRLYPSVKDWTDVPLDVRRSYEEAKKVRYVSPLAFLALIRRALEFVCEDKSAKGRDLYEKLADLSKRGIIPATLADMADTIRFFGNIGSHAKKMKVGYGEAHLVGDFFDAVIEYVYLAPGKIKKAKEKVEELKSKGQ